MQHIGACATKILVTFLFIAGVIDFIIQAYIINSDQGLLHHGNMLFWGEYCMDQNSYVNYFDNPAQYIKTVKKEWENFICTGSISGLSVRNEILKSWEQSIKSGISYLQDGAKLVLDEKGMSKVYAKNSMLISASQPILVEFANMLTKRGTGGSIINLCDGDTVILKTLSSNSIAKEAAESQHLLPGAILSEQYSGTTGVAMVRNTLQPYAIYGSEHFSIAAKAWCCAAAPIRNIGTRELMGILSLTGENLNVSPDTMGMITFVARTIESEMYSEYVYRSNFLNERFQETISAQQSGSDPCR